LTPEKRQRIEDMAHRRGYNAPEDYLLALVDMDAAVQDEHDFESNEGILAAMRESFHQAVTGDTRPISELWDALNADRHRTYHDNSAVCSVSQTPYQEIS